MWKAKVTGSFLNLLVVRTFGHRASLPAVYEIYDQLREGCYTAILFHPTFVVDIICVSFQSVPRHLISLLLTGRLAHLRQRWRSSTGRESALKAQVTSRDAETSEEVVQAESSDGPILWGKKGRR